MRSTRIALLATLLLPLSAAWPATHSSDRGTVYLPDDIGPGAVVPVVIVEGGLGASHGRVWPALSARLPVIVVETRPIREALSRPTALTEVRDAVYDALRYAEEFHDVARCPWILVAFSAAAPEFGVVGLDEPGRFQGLAWVNAAVTRNRLAADLEAARDTKMVVVHGTLDPIVPLVRGEQLHAWLADAGLDVALRTVETSRHLAPLTEDGIGPLAEFVEGIAKQAPAGRRVPVEPRTVETKAADGLRVVADVYETGDRTQPVLLLCHQARSSRGEYRRIAPRLVERGFNCVALDQRSGSGWDSVDNETARAAMAAGLPTNYLDARADIERGIAWVRELGFTGPLGLLGSSYSASLAVFVAADHAAVKAVVTFSPGDYLPPRGSIFETAAAVKQPVLVVCPPNEEESVRPVYEALPAEGRLLLVQDKGVHGASTLVRSPTAEQAWQALLEFLAAHLKE